MRLTTTTIFVALGFLACACGSKGKDKPAPSSKDDSAPAARAATTTSPETRALDPSLFLAAGLAGPITEKECTLANGKRTTCVSIKRKSVPTDHKQGPWCPTKVSDGAEEGGIWPEGGVAHDVTGEFIKNLAGFYKDSKWAVHNDDGTINVTKSAAECAAAARPDVDPALNNHCVQCLPSYLEPENVDETLIPKRPIMAASSSQIRSNIGLAFNGVEFAASAPTHAILAAHTLAPFDDCGGHINMHEGYHYHAITKNCLTEIVQPDGHAPMIGYALDGFPIHARAATDAAEPTDLDDCRGHTDETRGYHYHVSGPGKNKILGCFTGEIVRSDRAGRGAPSGRGGPPPGDGQPDRGGPQAPTACTATKTEKCCGDKVCDGPETPSNCAADCRAK